MEEERCRREKKMEGWYLSRAVLDSLHFANGSRDRDLLLDVPSKGSFIPAGRTASSYFEVLGNRQGLVVAQETTSCPR
ncbi:hypothetical protein J1N35_020043 [Gossypium stocksii]|uniref:Uncharacterized protein n=1 Tax=Gossypium stocksii TaxID=47602 RepID=A0A9D3VDC5_9ROSI|nr:hypothetical protein J1N35_020043 [Gossypium stocksii]